MTRIAFAVGDGILGIWKVVQGFSGWTLPWSLEHTTGSDLLIIADLPALGIGILLIISSILLFLPFRQFTETRPMTKGDIKS